MGWVGITPLRLLQLLERSVAVLTIPQLAEQHHQSHRKQHSCQSRRWPLIQKSRQQGQVEPKVVVVVCFPSTQFSCHRSLSQRGSSNCRHFQSRGSVGWSSSSCRGRWRSCWATFARLGSHSFRRACWLVESPRFCLQSSGEVVQSFPLHTFSPGEFGYCQSAI